VLLSIGWKVQHVLLSGVSVIASVIRPAGLEASTGAVTSFWLKSPEDPMWDDDPDMKEYRAFMKQWAPGELVEESAFAYATAQMIVEVLKRCGDDLSRENLLKQATNVRDLQLPLFLPGVTINTSPTSRVAWRRASMARFDGAKWVLFGDILSFPADNQASR
jgi:hypothetical protein